MRSFALYMPPGNGRVVFMTTKEAIQHHGEVSQNTQRKLHRLMDQAGFSLDMLDEAIGYMREIHNSARKMGIAEATDRAVALFKFEAENA